jgi:hypothetical protein
MSPKEKERPLSVQGIEIRAAPYSIYVGHEKEQIIYTVTSISTA